VEVGAKAIGRDDREARVHARFRQRSADVGVLEEGVELVEEVVDLGQRLLFFHAL
jgi:hypothetical protein